MAQVIDDLALTNPERKICSMPESPDSAHIYVDLNVKSLSQAINYTAWWIEKSFGKCASFDETLAFLGANDVRYLVMVIACNKTGFKVRLLNRAAYSLNEV
jgi:hypothetical protein